MPIWFELIFLLLITYAIGLGIGWTMWGGAMNEPEEIERDRTGDKV